MKHNKISNVFFKPMIGFILCVLWLCGAAWWLLLQDSTQEVDLKQLCKGFGIEYTAQIKHGTPLHAVFNQKLKMGMTRSEVDEVMRGYWFKITDEVNKRDVFFYKKGLSALEYGVYFSTDSKYLYWDEGGWTTFHPIRDLQIVGVTLRLAPEGKNLLRFIWILKWGTIFYVLWLVASFIDKWRQKNKRVESEGRLG